ncbi:MAG: hypothetical protein ACREMB_01135 [Candidatus Rokuibacteriota bacterium]
MTLHDTPAASRPRALVLGIEHPRGIAVVRSLGRRGIPVVGVERDPRARGRGSRYLQQVVMVQGGDERAPSPRWRRWPPTRATSSSRPTIGVG